MTNSQKTQTTRPTRVIVGEVCPIELFGRDTEQDKRDALAQNADDYGALHHMFLLGYNMSTARVWRPSRSR